MAMRAMEIVLLLTVAIFAQPGLNALKQDDNIAIHDAGFNAVVLDAAIHGGFDAVSAGQIFSLAESMLSMAEKIEPGPFAELHFALRSMKFAADLMNTAFTPGTDGSWEINQEIEDAYYEASIKGKECAQKVYAAAVKAETAVSTLRAVQESLKRKPGHRPTLEELQRVIDGGSLTMAQSIETQLDDALSAYTGLIKQCQTSASVIENKRKGFVIKICCAAAIGVLISCGAASPATQYVLFGQIYSAGFGVAMAANAAISLSLVHKLKSNLTIIENRIKYLRDRENEAGRLRSSFSTDIQSLFLTIQGKLEGISEVTASDLRMEDGMRRFLSSEMTSELEMYSYDLLKLQDACSQLKDSIDKALKDRAFKSEMKG